VTLEACPECGHEVSDIAEVCPNCGHPLHESVPRPAASPSSVEPSNMAQKPYAWILAISGGAIAVGSFLPWRTLRAALIGSVDVAGTEGDGVITLVVGGFVVLIGILALTRGISRVSAIIGLVLAGVAGWVAYEGLASALEVIDEINSDPDGLAQASVGIGLWIVAIGAIGAIVGSIGCIANPAD
jgi:hypothetical protein